MCAELSTRRAGSCDSRYLNTEKLDDLVISKLREHILTPENLHELATLVAEEINSNAESSRAEIEAVRADMADTTRRLERLYDAVETGKIPLDDLAPRIREMRARVDTLHSRKAELEITIAEEKAEVPCYEEVAQCARELASLLQTGSFAERKAFVRSFVKNITIKNNRL